MLTLRVGYDVIERLDALAKRNAATAPAGARITRGTLARDILEMGLREAEKG